MKYIKTTVLIALFFILFTVTSCSKSDHRGCVLPPFVPTTFALIQSQNYSTKKINYPLQKDTIKYYFFSVDSCIKMTNNDTTKWSVNYKYDTIPFLQKSGIVATFSKPIATTTYDSIVYQKIKYEHSYNGDTLKLFELDNANPCCHWFIRQ